MSNQAEHYDGQTTESEGEALRTVYGMTMLNQCTLLQTLEHAISQVSNLTDQLDQMTVVLEQQTKIINYMNENMHKMAEALAFICAMKAP